MFAQQLNSTGKVLEKNSLNYSLSSRMHLKCPGFLEEFVALLTYQSDEEPASISNLLKYKGKWNKEKGF